MTTIPGFAKGHRDTNPTPPRSVPTPDAGNEADGDLRAAPLLPEWPFAALRDLGAQLAAANSKLANVAALIAKAKKVSPSDRMVVYVGDLEQALGLRDEPARTRTGANDEGTTT